MPECFFAGLPGAGECDGGIVRCHLITKSLMRREWRALHHGDAAGHVVADRFARQRGASLPKTLKALLVDPRTWVPGCGGLTGCGGHNGRMKPDGPVPVPREVLPPELELLAADLDAALGLEVFGSWLDRTYGERSANAA